MTVSKQRLEALNDGVVAIIITIMVLGIQVPDGTQWVDIKGLLKDIFIFFASFVVVGMFWNLHRRLFEYLEGINEKLVWRNLLFLFVLAIIPIFTKWIMQHPDTTIPVAGYGIVFLLVHLSSSFLFSCAIPLLNEKARKIMMLRSKSSSYAAIITILAGIGLILIGAFFFPGISTWLLIGYPIILAVVNLWFEQSDMEHQDKAQIMKRKARKRNPIADQNSKP